MFFNNFSLFLGGWHQPTTEKSAKSEQLTPLEKELRTNTLCILHQISDVSFYYFHTKISETIALAKKVSF